MKTVKLVWAVVVLSAFAGYAAFAQRAEPEPSPVTRWAWVHVSGRMNRAAYDSGPDHNGLGLCFPRVGERLLLAGDLVLLKADVVQVNEHKTPEAVVSFLANAGLPMDSCHFRFPTNTEFTISGIHAPYKTRTGAVTLVNLTFADNEKNRKQCRNLIGSTVTVALR